MIVFPAKVAVTPAGSPVAAPIPVAPEVVKVMSGEIVVPKQNVGFEDGGLTVLVGFTVIVPIALIKPQPPVKGME